MQLRCQNPVPTTTRFACQRPQVALSRSVGLSVCSTSSVCAVVMFVQLCISRRYERLTTPRHGSCTERCCECCSGRGACTAFESTTIASGTGRHCACTAAAWTCKKVKCRNMCYLRLSWPSPRGCALVAAGCMFWACQGDFILHAVGQFQGGLPLLCFLCVLHGKWHSHRTLAAVAQFRLWHGNVIYDATWQVEKANCATD